VVPRWSAYGSYVHLAGTQDAAAAGADEDAVGYRAGDLAGQPVVVSLQAEIDQLGKQAES